MGKIIRMLADIRVDDHVTIGGVTHEVGWRGQEWFALTCVPEVEHLRREHEAVNDEVTCLECIAHEEPAKPADRSDGDTCIEPRGVTWW